MSPIEFGPIDQAWIKQYAELSGDHNPLHQDKDFAQSAGLKSPIAHGMLSLGLATSALSQWGLKPEQTKAIDCKFRDMVFVGEKLVAELDSKSDSAWEMSLKKSSGELVLSVSARL